MENSELDKLVKRLALGFDKAREKLLREKAALDQPVVYGYPDGTIREIPGKVAYAEYLAEKKAK